MSRKQHTIKNVAGRSIRVSIGTSTPERIIDPTGVLTQSSQHGGLNEEEHAAFIEWKNKIKLGEVKS